MAKFWVLKGTNFPLCPLWDFRVFFEFDTLLVVFLFLVFFHHQCGCLGFFGEITVSSIFLRLKLPLLLCLVPLFLIIGGLYHQLYSYYLVYGLPERERVTSKSLEEARRPNTKNKKYFDVTQWINGYLTKSCTCLCMKYALESDHLVQNPKRKIEY